MPAAPAHARHPRAPPFVEPPGYTRQRPENTLLFQLIEPNAALVCNFRLRVTTITIAQIACSV